MGSHDGALLDVRPGHPEDVNDPAVQEILAAMRDLPTDEQEAVRGRLAAVALNFERTGQVDPLIHFMQSLLVTARLHRNPAYRKSLAEADEAEHDEPTGSGNVADFMAAMRERRSQ